MSAFRTVNRSRLVEAARFGAVGAAQNLLNIAVFALLVAVGVGYLAAAVVAAVVALLASFLANRAWTFAGAPERRATGQVTVYAAIFGAASLGALGLLAFFTEVIGLPKVIGQALSLLLMAPSSYLAQRHFTFRAGRATTIRRAGPDSSDG